MNTRFISGAHAVAEEEACNDVEQFGSWLACVSDDREPSVYWGPISTPEIVRTMLSGMANAQQCEMLCRELRDRYLKEFEKQIEQRAVELSPLPLY